jgi:DNA polymerase III subunit delta'
MALKDIIGQDKAVGMLSRIATGGRVASSYLFTGDAGIGKKTAAISFAKALNCLAPVIDASADSPAETVDASRPTSSDACERCASCMKINANIHPDFLLIEPESGQIRIEEVRKLDEILSLKAFEGRYKVIIIDEADALNQYAANALLKTLEEPPQDSLLILVSSRPERLPDTIRSRCAAIRFSPVSQKDCERIIEGIEETGKKTKGRSSGSGTEKSEERNVAVLARLSMGRPGNAAAVNLIEEREWFRTLLKSMLSGEKDGWGSREEMERWFDLVLIMLRDLAVMKVMKDGSHLINEDISGYLESLSGRTSLHAIITGYKELSVLRSYFRFNLNKSLTWNYTGCLLRKGLDVTYA